MNEILNDEKPQKTTIQLEVDSDLLEAIEGAAKLLKTDSKTLMKNWISEPLLRPIDEIDHVARNEEMAYRELRDFMGESMGWLQKILDLYRLLGELLGKTKNTLDAHQMAALLHCLQACRYNMIMGNLACLRGHPIDHSNYRRKAIEFCAFAIKMMRSPDHATIWMNAISNRAYDKYEKAFEICATIAESADIMGPGLKKLYSTLSQQVHASPFAIATQIRIDNRVHILDYFQHQTPEKKNFLAMTFLSAAGSDYQIVKALGEIIKQKTLTFDEKTWSAALADIDVLENKIKDAWAPTLDPTGDYRKGKKPPKPGTKTQSKQTKSETSLLYQKT